MSPPRTWLWVLFVCVLTAGGLGSDEALRAAASSDVGVHKQGEGDRGEAPSDMLAKDGRDAAGAGRIGDARRSLLAMGASDVDAAINRLLEAKREALEYASKCVVRPGPPFPSHALWRANLPWVIPSSPFRWMGGMHFWGMASRGQTHQS